MNSKVSVYKINSKNIEYPTGEEYFRPNQQYPDCIFSDLAVKENAVYPAVRKAIELLQLDSANIGEKSWNPFKDFIKKGDCVLIKPNMVQEKNNNSTGGTQCLYTQPSILAPILDFTFKALDGTGEVIIGDAPMQECNINVLIRESGYNKLIEYYRNKGLNICLADFRRDKAQFKLRINHRSVNDSVKGITVNLGKESEFYGLDDSVAKKFRIVDYPSSNIYLHHHGNTQEYYISEYVLKADVIINVPKPKTHKKAGITAALKNLVGINSQKDYLPHHTFGSAEEGGDEYKTKNWLQNYRGKLYDRKYELEKNQNYSAAQMIWFRIAICTVMLRLFRVKYENGSWYGNNTISKTITDLNKIVLYADKKGMIHDEPVRKYISICDMVICGEKNGPVAPSPKYCGLIVAGTNPVDIDKIIATMMGFDVNKIPTLVQIENSKHTKSLVRKETATIVSNVPSLNGITYKEIRSSDSFHFIAPDGWKGFIENDK